MKKTIDKDNFHDDMVKRILMYVVKIFDGSKLTFAEAGSIVDSFFISFTSNCIDFHKNERTLSESQDFVKKRLEMIHEGLLIALLQIYGLEDSKHINTKDFELRTSSVKNPFKNLAHNK